MSHRISHLSVKAFVTEVMQSLGARSADAAIMASYVVSTSLRGVDTHGLRLFAKIVHEVLRGKVVTTSSIDVVKRSGAMCIIDGCNGIGIVVGTASLHIAADLARRNGVGIACVRGSNTLGSLAFYAEEAAALDMVSIVLTNARGEFMAPWGGRTPLVGNNPIAIGIPAGDEHPLVLDMALSTAARGRILKALDEGAPAIPSGWALSRSGDPTTSPAEAAEGLLTPLGGPKGAALAIAVGCLCSTLSGASFDSEISEAGSEPRNSGHVFIVIDVRHFEELGSFVSRVQARRHELRGSARVDADTAIRLPGDRASKERAYRTRHGIPVPEQLLRRLQRIGADVGVMLAD